MSQNTCLAGLMLSYPRVKENTPPLPKSGRGGWRIALTLSVHQDISGNRYDPKVVLRTRLTIKVQSKNSFPVQHTVQTLVQPSRKISFKNKLFSKETQVLFKKFYFTLLKLHLKTIKIFHPLQLPAPQVIDSNTWKVESKPRTSPQCSQHNSQQQNCSKHIDL